MCTVFNMLSKGLRVKAQVSTKYGPEVRSKKDSRCLSPLFSGQSMKKGPTEGQYSRQGCVPFGFPLYLEKHGTGIAQGK